MGAFSGIESAGDAWNATKLGGVPMLGTITNGAMATLHAGEAGIDAIAGDNDRAKDNLSIAAIDAVKAIPGVGTAATIAQGLNDIHAGNPQEPDTKDGYPYPQPTTQQSVRNYMFGPSTGGAHGEDPGSQDYCPTE